MVRGSGLGQGSEGRVGRPGLADVSLAVEPQKQAMQLGALSAGAVDHIRENMGSNPFPGINAVLGKLAARLS